MKTGEWLIGVWVVIVLAATLGFLLALPLAAPESRSLLPDLLKGLPSAFVALVIGAIATWVAYQQWRVGRAKFRLDLFEHRYELYVILWTFLSVVDGDDHKVAATALAELNNSAPKAYFLFGDAIGDFFRECQKQGAAARRTRIRLMSPDVQGASRTAAEEANKVAVEEVSRLMGLLQERFDPYLNFADWA